MNFIEALKVKISELQEYEFQAIKIKDLHSAILMHGAIIQMQKFLKEMENGCTQKNKDQA